ncbi:Serine/threonine-protein phosphatase 2A regulatory subunit B'' subunit beta [Smittium mucronatum]|uniref:Serine/threonine-protein phosphatase 2A regulatory subunit B'' subunit beta n=1 Tax=Smittium mucronatum TaxID=133383 RepID=A0A1R0GUJ3_9FUNG|nr:Serine/threonine-protein phosphatase 2A regulatory subunit B'' subunit beta [Smittium mucronatum]
MTSSEQQVLRTPIQSKRTSKLPPDVSPTSKKSDSITPKLDLASCHSPITLIPLEKDIKADELSMCSKWSPQIKSAGKTTIASRLRDSFSPRNGNSFSNNDLKSSSPLGFKQNAFNSPENLPPLSPLVKSNKGLRLRHDLNADTPFSFSPTGKSTSLKHALDDHLKSPLSQKSTRLTQPNVKLYDLFQESEDETPKTKYSRSLFDEMKIGSPTFKRLKLDIQQDNARDTAQKSSESSFNEASLFNFRPLSKKNTTLNPSELRDLDIPLLYLYGTSLKQKENFINSELANVKNLFDESFGHDEKDFVNVTLACGLPRYANRALFTKIKSESPTSTLKLDVGSWPSFETFSRVWKTFRYKSLSNDHLLYEVLLNKGSRGLSRNDFLPLVNDVISNHPELEFLQDQQIFSQNFAQTIIERIFYEANSYIGDSMTLSQFKKVNLYNVLVSIETAVDVQVRAISRILLKKGKNCPSRDEEEIAAKKKLSKKKKKGDHTMNYLEFIWFLLSEVDKTTEVAAGYWFRIMDLDEDGVLTVFEMEYFYDEQIRRMQNDTSTGDTIPMRDILCQLFDLINPSHKTTITLKDILNTPSQIRPIFFDAFLNLNRFCEHDSRSSLLQRQLSAFTQSLGREIEFKDLIDRRIEFLASGPPVWIEFADAEYEALIADQKLQEQE